MSESEANLQLTADGMQIVVGRIYYRVSHKQITEYVPIPYYHDNGVWAPIIIRYDSNLRLLAIGQTTRLYNQEVSASSIPINELYGDKKNAISVVINRHREDVAKLMKEINGHTSEIDKLVSERDKDE